MAHLGEKLKSLRLEKGMNQPQMAEFVGVAYRTYQDIEKTGKTKKVEVLEKIMRKTGLDTQKIATKDDQEDKPNEPVKGQDLSLQAIHNLTESGKKLASAHEIMASAQQTMATNEARLISLLENKSIVGDPKDTGVASAQVMRGILVGMAKIASGTRWHSEQEAIRELGRLIDEPVLGSKKDESIQTDGGKHSTG
jgi:transcriptional regulator with XRE-family HTH domain